MTSNRLTLRLPQQDLERLRDTAAKAGYTSASALARCILMQFLHSDNQLGLTLSSLTAWMDEYVEDHLDPRFRKHINERL